MVKTKILVVDDEPDVLQACGLALKRVPDTVVVLEQDSRFAAEMLESERFDLLLTDLRMPEVDGVELLSRARRKDPEISVICLTGYPTVETAIRCLKLGAADYITKPVNEDELRAMIDRLVNEKRLQRENSLLLGQLEKPFAATEFIGDGPGARSVTDLVARVAASDVDVLVTGETGVGKELVARSIHRASWRKDSHFVPVDCTAIPEHLLESELFGHERGAYTSADRTKIGLLELADGGTVFLDEIGELPLSLQPKLLRVLQERKFRRVGGRDEIAVNIRVTAATNRDLQVLIQQQRFREDLYYRIKVARIDVPPLRERVEDVMTLVRHFLARYSAEMGREGVEVDPAALELLQRYAWPGNVRELQNLVRWLLTVAKSGLITADDLPEEIATLARERAAPVLGSFFDLREKHLARFERTYLENLLTTLRGDVTEAAVQAKIPRGTLYRLLKKYGITPDGFRE